MAWPGVGKHHPDGVGNGPRFGHGILDGGVPGCEKSELGNAPQDLEKDSRLGHGSWRGRVVWAGHGAHASLDSGPGSRFGLGLVAGDCVWEGVCDWRSMLGARES